jgi:hypothetical protein
MVESHGLGQSSGGNTQGLGNQGVRPDRRFLPIRPFAADSQSVTGVTAISEHSLIAFREGLKVQDRGSAVRFPRLAYAPGMGVFSRKIP